MAPAEHPPTRHPDEMLYSVTVDNDDTTTVQYSDSTLTEEVRRLTAWVDQRPESRHEVGRPR